MLSSFSPALIAPVAVIVLGACSGPAGPRDANPVDATPVDARPVDAATEADVVSPDTGVDACDGPACMCAAPRVFCAGCGGHPDGSPPGYCADLQSDRNHCGACGVVCGADQICDAGHCVSCSSGLQRCSNHCVDTQTNDDHCGSCGTRCGGATRCRAGSCQCADGLIPCGVGPNTRCVLLAGDPANCGSCGHVCAAGLACSFGGCISVSRCVGLAIMCPSGCTDVRFDPLNCGACGAACPVPSGGFAICQDSLCGVSCHNGFRQSGDRCVSIDAPRLVAPISASLVTSARPTLRWELAAGSDGAHVELCRDRACSSTFGSLDAAGTSARPSTDLPAGAVYWHAAGTSGGAMNTEYSAVWEFFVGPRPATTDTVLGPRLDVNGDGIADVVAVSPRPSMYSDESTLYFYAGSHSGLPATPTNSLTSNLYLRMDSPYLSNGGDLNGDGFGDVLAHWGQGVVVALGGPTGLTQAVGAWSVPSPGITFTAFPVGDVNGDGYSDMVVDGQLLCLGARTGPSCSGRMIVGPGLRSPIGSVGGIDINGDGSSDLFAASNGLVYAFLGDPGLPATQDTFLVDPQSLVSSIYPMGVGVGGDVNGDGYADVVYTGTVLRSNVYVHLGGACFSSAPDLVLTPAAAYPGSLIGPVSTAGDFNGDGYSDVVAMASSVFAVVFNGGPSGPAAAMSAMIGFGTGLGQLDVPGDVNGDGYDDVVQGGLTDRVPVYYGSPSGLATTPSTTLTAPSPDAGFGASAI